MSNSSGEAAGRKARAVAAVLVVTLVSMALELRWEHRKVLGHHWEAWIPLVYCLAMIPTGIAGLATWSRRGRDVLLFGFLGAVMVGVAGLLFHDGGHLAAKAGHLASIWMTHPGETGGVPVGHGPPILAPGAFVGIGMIGLIACWPDRG